MKRLVLCLAALVLGSASAQTPAPAVPPVATDTT